MGHSSAIRERDFGGEGNSLWNGPPCLPSSPRASKIRKPSNENRSPANKWRMRSPSLQREECSKVSLRGRCPAPGPGCLKQQFGVRVCAGLQGEASTVRGWAPSPWRKAGDPPSLKASIRYKPQAGGSSIFWSEETSPSNLAVPSQSKANLTIVLAEQAPSMPPYPYP